MWSWIKGLFNKYIKFFRDFVCGVFSNTAQVIIGKLKNDAIMIVEELSKSNLTDEMKRQEAFKLIKEKSEIMGLASKDSIINLLIEMAVSYIKNKGTE